LFATLEDALGQASPAIASVLALLQVGTPAHSYPHLIVNCFVVRPSTVTNLFLTFLSPSGRSLTSLPALWQEALLLRGGITRAHLAAWADEDDGNDSLLDFDEEVRWRERGGGAF
jgi:hypothetical protein